ncbi:TIGR03545 family protein [Chromatiaceae bacterium AAb-1]|nr:TIGR03545 family protein [Chromatiaceae bacterium AAb-1]
MIRKSGWLVFLSLLAAVLVLVYVFAGSAIRIAMIYGLEKAVGAEVNIDKVALSLAPLALTVNNLQVTDAAQPTHNSLSFKQARAALEVWPALLGYYVINDLTVDGMAYGQERARPGKVYQTPETAESEKVDLAELLQLDLPDTNELIARANLQTVAKGQALQELATQEQQQLENLKSQLPDKNTLQQYQTEIKQLTESKIENAADLAAKAEQLKQLKEKLNTEKARLQQVKQQLENSKTKLQAATSELQQASTADWQHLQQLANLTDGGLAGISQILLGDVWGERVAQLQSLYLLVKPYIPENTAETTTRQEEVILPNRILPLPSQPYPDFWVKNARINWLIGGGEATIAMQDITAQHQLINSATRFALDVKQLPQLSQFSLQGDFAILQQMITNVSWQLDGLSLQPLALGKDSNTLDLAAGLLNSTGSLKLTDNQITQQATVLLQQADFSATGNKYLQQLAGLLNQQQQIPLNIAATGLISKPDVSIRSSLDKILGDALLGEAREKVAAYQQDLKAQLDSKLQAQLGAQNEWSSLLQQQDLEVSELSGSIENMLEAKLGDFKDQAKDQLKDKLLNKLGKS